MDSKDKNAKTEQKKDNAGSEIHLKVKGLQKKPLTANVDTSTALETIDMKTEELRQTYWHKKESNCNKKDDDISEEVMLGN